MSLKYKVRTYVELGTKIAQLPQHFTTKMPQATVINLDHSPCLWRLFPESEHNNNKYAKKYRLSIYLASPVRQDVIQSIIHSFIITWGALYTYGQRTKVAQSLTTVMLASILHPKLTSLSATRKVLLQSWIPQDQIPSI